MKILMVILIVLILAITIGFSITVAFIRFIKSHEDDGVELPIDFRNDDIFMYVEDDKHD